MQYTQLRGSAATTSRFSIQCSDLAQAFASVPDPRRSQGRRYSAASLLCLAVAAILCNARSVLAIAEWGQAQPLAVRQALGLPADHCPSQSTLHRLFRRLDAVQLSSALSSFFDQPGSRRQRGEQGVAVDGKCQRGRLQFEANTACKVHELNAFSHDVGVVLGQLVVANQTGMGELSAAPALLGSINWQGRVLTGDALYCQVNLCQQVLAAGGDYLLVVKENQPNLLAELELLFAAPEMQNASAAARLNFDYRVSSKVEKGHGRLEQRQLIASNELRGYSRWPGLQQVLRLERRWTSKGVTHYGVHYLVSSLSSADAGVMRLLELRRGHWQIENSLHWVKDVTLGEDGSLIHVGNGAANMSALRGVVISLIHRSGERRIAATLRANSVRPQQALLLMGLLNSSGA